MIGRLRRFRCHRVKVEMLSTKIRFAINPAPFNLVRVSTFRLLPRKIKIGRRFRRKKRQGGLSAHQIPSTQTPKKKRVTDPEPCKKS